jgi:hypothetical protein
MQRAEVVREEPDAVAVDTAERRRHERAGHRFGLRGSGTTRRERPRYEASQAVLRDRDAFIERRHASLKRI